MCIFDIFYIIDIFYILYTVLCVKYDRQEHEGSRRMKTELLIQLVLYDYDYDDDDDDVTIYMLVVYNHHYTLIII